MWIADFLARPVVGWRRWLVARAAHGAYPRRPDTTALRHYFLLLYLAMLLLTSGFVRVAQAAAPAAVWFTVMLWLTYTLIYLAPALALGMLGHRLLVGRRVAAPLSRWRLAVAAGWVIALGTLVTVLLYADLTIFRMFGFHLNGFVLNLVLTPGGVASMGGSTSTSVTLALWLAGWLAAQGVALVGLHAWLSRRAVRPDWQPRRWYRWGLAALVLMSLAERVSYGVCKLRNATPVLQAATAFPAYLPMSFGHTAKRLGVPVARQEGLSMELTESQLLYPLRPITSHPPAKPYNIVWLTAESWRHDMLNPETMPATWAFAQRATRFTQHYSGGNGTRMGLFAMFYGLYGAYWFDFLKEQRGPVLIDVLQEQRYQLEMYTSAAFTYPEFDRTLFADVPASQLHQDSRGQNWERDRANVASLLTFIGGRDRSRPFMTFMFFESPHARYYFPPECVIRPNYLPDLNYATVNTERDIGRIRDRYVNACRHLDTQFARVLEALEEQQLLDSTIVLITGDHGEEFMEHGRWGHNSEFTEQQTRTPLVLWVPGRAAAVVDRLTSHLDLPATLLPLLGVANPPSDYSLGHDLLNGGTRAYTVVADWARLGYIDQHYKATIPLSVSRMLDNRVTTRDDQPVSDEQAVIRERTGVLLEIMADLRRFHRAGRVEKPVRVAAVAPSLGQSPVAVP